MTLYTAAGELVEVGKLYMVRCNRNILITGIERLTSGSYPYRIRVQYSDLGKTALIGGTDYRVHANGQQEAIYTSDWDIMNEINTKVELSTVESVTSAFKFMSMREKELRA